jgi:peptide-methionine (R)-S-oxide reductase
MNETKQESPSVFEKVEKSEEEWKQTLTPEQYHVLRQKGTERAFTGKYWNHHEDGTYTCAACGQELFTSDTKFDSGCGWPSFYDAKDNGTVVFHEDFSHGMHRIEVLCSRCGGHLGHVFNDGPQPTGQRYCINSVSIDFRKSAEKK